MMFTTKHVATKAELDNLYNNSALTLEGLAEESIPDFVNWLEENTTFTADNLDVYVIEGSVMNDKYSLYGDNAYPNDLTIVSVIDIDLMKVAIPRFSIGARWFDDIVDNNKMRQQEAE